MSERTPNVDAASGGEADRARLQQRTVRTLFVAVLPAGAAATAGFSSAALLGEEITGSDALGTLAAACVTIGTAVATVPVSRFMSRHGRRAGLRRAWSFAAAGAGLTLLAALIEFYPLLLIGAAGIGIGNAATLAARYAASDLATDMDRARSIGTLVWAGSFGSVLGPTIGLGWAGTVMRWLGLPKLAGPYVMSTALFAAAAWWIERRLHPDPLTAARALDGATVSRRPGAAGAPATAAAKPSASGDTRRIVRAAGRWRMGAGRQVADTARTLRVVFGHRQPRLAATAMLVGHAVMVGVMTATPLHMKDGDHALQIIGFVISLHIVGMYFFAPVVGRIVDTFGPVVVIGAGGAILFAGAELASHTRAQDSLGVFVGLFLVGLGWSFGLIAGSSLLTASFSTAERVAVQGAADLTMSAAGAFAALLAGLVYEISSYHALSHYAGFAAVALAVLAVWTLLRPMDPLPA